VVFLTKVTTTSPYALRFGVLLMADIFIDNENTGGDSNG